MTKEELQLEYERLRTALVDMNEVAHAMLMYNERDELRKEAWRLYYRIKERRDRLYERLYNQV